MTLFKTSPGATESSSGTSAEGFDSVDLIDLQMALMADIFTKVLGKFHHDLTATSL